MNFRIADTFTESLAKRTGEEQKAVKTTVFDLQLSTIHNSPSPAPGLRFHKLERADVDGNAESRKGTVSAVKDPETRTNVLWIGGAERCSEFLDDPKEPR